MKLNKKVEAEIMLVYDIWLHAYLNGDIKTYDDYLDEEYRFIGSTNNEEFLNRKDTTNFFKATAEQLSGKTEIRNNSRTIQQIGDLVFITDVFDAWFQNESEWAYYGRFRFSSALRKKEKEWKFVYQHFSTPDTKAQEGETIAYEKVADENLQLREAIRRRTVELEDKNRELEIEAATERVRVQSMAMQHPNDLEKVNKELLHQLTKLEIPGLTGVSFYFVDQDEIVTVWDLSSPGSMNDPNSYSFKYDSKKFPFLGEFVGILKSTQDEYFVLDFPKEKLLVGIEELKEINSTIYEAIKNAVESGVLLHQWNPAARITDGILSIDLMKPPGDDTKTILLKMAGAFNQAYTRFLDLQKAEAQAREAQIETALERVRSRSLVMHKSDELNEIVSVVFEKLKELQIPVTAVGIGIYIDGSKDLNAYVCGENKDGLVINNYRLPYFTHKISDDFNNAREKQLDFFVGNYSKEEKNAFYEYLFEHVAEIRHLPEDMKAMVFESPTYTITMVAVNNATFNINDFEGKILSEKEIDIIKRFAKVFDQSYTRFLDLQKAEAQTREAEIQLALERVRARSLAMHHTSELQEIVKIVAQQLQHMGLNINGGVFITINDELDQDFQLWASLGAADYLQKVIVPFFNRPIFTQLRDAIKKGNNFFDETYSKEEKDEMFQHLFHFRPWNELSKERRNELLSREGGLTRTAVISQNTSIVITNHNGNIFSTQEKDFLKRFGAVFEQSYTRFLDLQKAEAQTREAQIELGLERVRARTMAMQQSDELNDVAAILFNQLRSLGGSLWTCAIVLCNDLRNEDEFRTAFEGGLQPSVFVPHNEDEVHIKMYEGWKNAAELFTISKNGGELQAHYAYLMTVPSVKPTFEKMLASGISFPVWQKWHAAYFTAGYLMIITTEKYREESIFVRFAKVFEQTYTRFLDLKKAEAQAREAQIETGLERVRSRSLAMHNTSELQEVINTVHKELLNLNIAISGGSFIAINSDIETELRCWGSGGTADTSAEVHIPLYKKPFCINLINVIKNRPGFFTEEFTQKE